SPPKSARCCRAPLSVAAPPCAISSRPTAPPATSTRSCRSTAAEANPAHAAVAGSGRRCWRSAPRSGAEPASAERRRYDRVSRGGAMVDSADITLLLDAARGGDRAALDNVLATLYQELHSMARRQLAGQYGQTLDATALVHEAYLKLIGRREAQFDDRAHFFAYAASAMRSVVVDYARQRMAQKRGGDLHRVTDLPEDLEGGLRLDEDMLALDTALTRLAAVDQRL